MLNPHTTWSLQEFDSADKDEDEDDDDTAFRYDKSHVDYRAHIFPETVKQSNLLENPVAIKEFIKTFQFPTVSRYLFHRSYVLVISLHT